MFGHSYSKGKADVVCVVCKNATLEEWKERPSQYEVPRDQLVAKVRAILDGQS